MTSKQNEIEESIPLVSIQGLEYPEEGLPPVLGAVEDMDPFFGTFLGHAFREENVSFSHFDVNSQQTDDDHVFRSLYISSDFNFKSQMKKRSSSGMEELCTHGNLKGNCEEIECTEIHESYISHSAKRQVGGEGVQEYCVEVTYNSTKTTIYYRYTSFRILYEKLCKEFGTERVPPIPGKKFNKFSSDLVSQRMAGFNRFLTECLHDDAIARSRTFKSFLSPNPEARQIFQPR